MRASAGFPVSPSVGLTPTDEDLERQIERAQLCGLYAATLEGQRASFELMRQLIGKRSPAQIERMEREQGLR